MLTTLATVVAGLLGAGLVLMGANALFRPRGAGGFGIPDAPVEDPGFQPWLRVKGLREIAPGSFVFVLLAVAPRTGSITAPSAVMLLTGAGLLV
ncbi:DUF4267 domain-containing protein [Streptomyces sp. NBC_00441]|uniref:DUF4267 domain-containing protein n=1 Tax=Streptomyces sp. NBC_00441 TaxID=2975742 RepID=UPI002E291C55|nr:DUF4267 domain-containing protein [Streptomyces sp. NBC_00441]